MKISNEAINEKGYISKEITTENLSNGNYKIKINALPTGGKKGKEIELTFTQNGFNALLGTFLMFEKMQD